jgi:hypothetical protein
MFALVRYIAMLEPLRVFSILMEIVYCVRGVTHNLAVNHLFLVVSTLPHLLASFNIANRARAISPQLKES